MNINKTEILKALEVVKPGLANVELIAQATHFAFFKDRVVTFNDSISISCAINGLDITGAVRAEELYGFLKRAKGKEVNVEITDNELKLKAGRSKAGLTFQSDIEMPLEEISTKKDWHDLPDEFTDNLMFIKDCCSKEMSRGILTCVHVTDKFLEASDSLQLMRLAQEGWPFGDYLIPAENIAEIHKIEPSQVAESDGWLHFKNLGGVEISCRVMPDKFPKTEHLFKVKGANVGFPKTMPEILERVMVFTKGDQQDEMEIKLGKGKLLVNGKNDYGWFKEQASVKYDGKGGRFWISPVLLQNILKRSSKAILGDEKIKFKGTDWEYVAVLKHMEKK